MKAGQRRRPTARRGRQAATAPEAMSAPEERRDTPDDRGRGDLPAQDVERVDEQASAAIDGPEVDAAAARVASFSEGLPSDDRDEGERPRGDPFR